MRATLTRRELLQAAGAAALVATVGPGSAAGSDRWPSFAGDAANTGYSPDAAAPTADDVGPAWAFETGSQVVGSPVVADGTVYVGSTDSTLYAIAPGGAEGWSFDAEGVISASPAIGTVDGEQTVFVGSENGRLYGVDAAGGTEQWRFGTENSITASPTVHETPAGPTVFVGSRDGRLYAVDATDGTERWRYETNFAVQSTPAVTSVDDELVAVVGSDDGQVHAVAGGEERWTVETGGFVRSAPTVVDGTVYVGSNDTGIYAIDAATGDADWVFGTDGAVPSSPAVADGTVYVGSRDGLVYALDATEGTEQWTFDTGQAITSSPAVTAEAVYIASANGQVYGLGLGGEELWSVGTGRRVRSSPAVVDGTVYIGSNDRNVYALEAGQEAPVDPGTDDGSDGGGGAPGSSPEDEPGTFEEFQFLLWPVVIVSGIATVLGSLWAARRVGLLPEFDPDEVDAPEWKATDLPVWEVVLEDVIGRASETSRTATEDVLVTTFLDRATMDAPFVAYEIESYRDEPALVRLREPAALTEDDIGVLPGSRDEWHVTDDQLVFERVVDPGETIRTMVGRRDVDPEDAGRLLDGPDVEVEAVRGDRGHSDETPQ
ncbi:MAG: PQQ-binding-like beta-propeller repeat protein [Halovenus sp.]